jgi:hypothetical protein
LKRFNFVNNKWVKSQKVVNFPYDNFEPTQYLASVPQETILRHKELLELKAKNIKNHDCNDEITEFDLENDIEVSKRNVNHKDLKQLQQNVTQEHAGPSLQTENNIKCKPARRKRLVSTR